jgi:hypothetical protein
MFKLVLSHVAELIGTLAIGLVGFSIVLIHFFNVLAEDLSTIVLLFFVPYFLEWRCWSLSKLSSTSSILA